MKKLIVALCLVIGGCSLFTAQNLKTALDASALACVFASELTDAQAVASACSIDQALVPVIDQLIAQRDAAKKQGVHWGADAGK